MNFNSEISRIREDFLKELYKIKSSNDLEQLKIKYLGKKGFIANLMQNLKTCSDNERPLIGKSINDIKEEISSHIENSLKRIVEEEQKHEISREKIDITLPGRKKVLGKLHPITQMKNKMLDALISMGFSVELAPELESDYYNFESLNFPFDHPAREMQDSFYVDDKTLLRTHTTNVQVRVMEKYTPPLRVVSPGRCFRSENISARSHVFFHQLDIFHVDENVSMNDLICTLEEFYSRIFNQKTYVRIRPSYFPFVEPGIEVDLKCIICKGQGCRVCKHSGWLELAGAGMIHPEVFKFTGIDSEKYTGYAAGLGIDRLTMIYSEIKDIRLFTENDVKFLNQFPG